MGAEVAVIKQFMPAATQRESGTGFWSPLTRGRLGAAGVLELKRRPSKPYCCQAKSLLIGGRLCTPCQLTASGSKRFIFSPPLLLLLFKEICSPISKSPVSSEKDHRTTWREMRGAFKTVFEMRTHRFSSHVLSDHSPMAYGISRGTKPNDSSFERFWPSL